jgi:hypothetical protein
LVVAVSSFYYRDMPQGVVCNTNSIWEPFAYRCGLWQRLMLGLEQNPGYEMLKITL